MTVRVLIVDDQPIVRSGFHRILDGQPDLEVVGEAGDGSEALIMARATRPDVVVMDIRMPRMDGIEATRRLTAEPGSGVKVLILTTFDLDEYVHAALRAGASGFLLKDATRDELVHAVRTVAGGEALLAPTVTRRLIRDLLGRPAPVTPDHRLDSLTTREREVLEHLARGASNAEIAAQLYVGDATVKSHVAHVLMKLGLRDRVHAVIFAYESGLVAPGEPGP